MRNRRILPARWASSSWSFSSFTRNRRFGRASVTSPSISSFCSTAINTFFVSWWKRGHGKTPARLNSFHSRPHVIVIPGVGTGMHAGLLPSPVGPLYVAVEDGYLTQLYTNGRGAEPAADDPAFGDVRRQLDEYFAG